MSFLLPLIFLFSSCAFFSPPKEMERPPSLVTGIDAKFVSPTEIKSRLLMTDSMAGGDFKLRAFPLTAPYIEMNEQAWNRKKKLLSAAELAKTIAAQKKSFSEDRSCFKLELDVGKYAKMAKFKRWRGEIVDRQGVKYPLKWTAESLQAKVSSHRVKNFQGQKQNFKSQGRACTMTPVALELGFTMHLSPDWIPFPFDDKFALTWAFDEYKKVDGELIKVQKKKKKRHPWQ